MVFAVFSLTFFEMIVTINTDEQTVAQTVSKIKITIKIFKGFK